MLDHDVPGDVPAGGVYTRKSTYLRAKRASRGAGLDGRDEGVYLSRARARSVEKLSHTLLGFRGRLSVHGDQR